MEWARGQMARGIPRETICRLYLNIDSGLMSDEEARAYADAERELYEVMVERNLRGRALEHQGRVDDAIALYEQNVSDRFGGDHPYERLRVIYTKRKQYDDAIQVCQIFIDVADALLSSGSRRSDLKPKREKFAEWVTKLERVKRACGL
jgi:tetratricopeptide (TPR) repeat protein